MDQEFYFHQKGTAFGEEMQQGDKAEFKTTADSDNQRESEVSEDINQQPMNNAYVNMYHPFPAQNGYWMHEDAFRRPPAHGGYHGGGRPGFYGFGVPFLGGLASGLLVSSFFPPYGGYYPYYQYQQPYYPYYPYYPY